MLTFPEALAAVLKRRQMSASVAAAALGYSSKTALLRILNGESKPSSYEKCLAAAKSSDLLSLTQEECAQLERALQISTLGETHFIINHMLSSLLSPEPVDDGPALQALDGIKNCAVIEDLLCHVGSLKEIDVSIFGRCPASLLGRLSRLTKEADVRGVNHIIAVKPNDPDDYSTVGDARHIIFNSKYSIYTHISSRNDFSSWSFHSGIILITGFTSSGTRQSYMLVPVGSDAYHGVFEQNDNLLQLKDKITKQAAPHIRPIKTSRAYMNNPFPLNYACFIDEYRHIEHNREIITIKPDIPFFCIPPDLLLPIVTEAFSSVSALLPQDTVITRLYDIQKSRYNNLFEKSKDTHLILSRSGMEHFARMGRREDHFFLVRPYTPQERVIVLSSLLEKMQTCPHFSIWFASNPDLVINKEITSYENHALAIVDPNTTWNIGLDHQEILLESKLLASCFSNYVKSQILPYDVYPRKESIRIMREMIHIAEQSE